MHHLPGNRILPPENMYFLPWAGNYACSQENGPGYQERKGLVADSGSPFPLGRAKIRKIAADLPDQLREELAAALLGMALTAADVAKAAGQGRFTYHAGYTRALNEVADLFGSARHD